MLVRSDNCSSLRCGFVLQMAMRAMQPRDKQQRADCTHPRSFPSLGLRPGAQQPFGKERASGVAMAVVDSTYAMWTLYGFLRHQTWPPHCPSWSRRRCGIVSSPKVRDYGDPKLGQMPTEDMQYIIISWHSVIYMHMCITNDVCV